MYRAAGISDEEILALHAMTTSTDDSQASDNMTGAASTSSQQGTGSSYAMRAPPAGATWKEHIARDTATSKARGEVGVQRGPTKALHDPKPKSATSSSSGGGYNSSNVSSSGNSSSDGGLGSLPRPPNTSSSGGANSRHREFPPVIDPIDEALNELEEQEALNRAIEASLRLASNNDNPHKKALRNDPLRRPTKGATLSAAGSTAINSSSKNSASHSSSSSSISSSNNNSITSAKTRVSHKPPPAAPVSSAHGRPYPKINSEASAPASGSLGQLSGDDELAWALEESLKSHKASEAPKAQNTTDDDNDEAIAWALYHALNEESPGRTASSTVSANDALLSAQDRDALQGYLQGRTSALPRDLQQSTDAVVQSLRMDFSDSSGFTGSISSRTVLSEAAPVTRRPLQQLRPNMRSDVVVIDSEDEEDEALQRALRESAQTYSYH